MHRIYLDHNATTPVEPEAAASLTQALADEFGNASSIHSFGQQAKSALDRARTSVARLLGADTADTVFTAGGTEADNLALRGVAAQAAIQGRRHFIASSIPGILEVQSGMTRPGGLPQ